MCNITMTTIQIFIKLKEYDQNVKQEKLWFFFAEEIYKNYEAITFISKIGILFESDYRNNLIYDEILLSFTWSLNMI